MAKKTQQEDEVLVDVTQSISKLEQFFEENRQYITILAVAIFAVVGGYISYLKFYQEPLELEAENAIFRAQQLFEADSLNEAVNGVTNDYLGFLDVAAEYGSTKAGNLANYYAGVSYLRLGQFENAIKLLDEFHTQDPILGVIAKGSIGDAFLELGQKEEAMEYYQKAVKVSDNDYVVPFYLLKAGLLAEQLGKNEEAKGYYETIKAKYPDSRQGTDIDRYLGRVTSSK